MVSKDCSNIALHHENVLWLFDLVLRRYSTDRRSCFDHSTSNSVMADDSTVLWERKPLNPGLLHGITSFNSPQSTHQGLCILVVEKLPRASDVFNAVDGKFVSQP